MPFSSSALKLFFYRAIPFFLTLPPSSPVLRRSVPEKSTRLAGETCRSCHAGPIPPGPGAARYRLVDTPRHATPAERSRSWLRIVPRRLIPLPSPVADPGTALFSELRGGRRSACACFVLCCVYRRVVSIQSLIEYNIFGNGPLDDQTYTVAFHNSTSNLNSYGR